MAAKSPTALPECALQVCQQHATCCDVVLESTVAEADGDTAGDGSLVPRELRRCSGIPALEERRRCRG